MELKNLKELLQMYKKYTITVWLFLQQQHY